MILIKVIEEDKQFAKQQIQAFEKIDAGSWRYTDVAAWYLFYVLFCIC